MQPEPAAPKAGFNLSRELRLVVALIGVHPLDDVSQARRQHAQVLDGPVGIQDPCSLQSAPDDVRASSGIAAGDLVEAGVLLRECLRFGGYELQDSNHAKVLLQKFFAELFRHFQAHSTPR